MGNRGAKVCGKPIVLLLGRLLVGCLPKRFLYLRARRLVVDLGGRRVVMSQKALQEVLRHPTVSEALRHGVAKQGYFRDTCKMSTQGVTSIIVSQGSINRAYQEREQTL